MGTMKEQELSGFRYILQAEPKGLGHISDMKYKIKKNDYKILDNEQLDKWNFHPGREMMEEQVLQGRAGV